jgi:hypothetical protein
LREAGLFPDKRGENLDYLGRFDEYVARIAAVPGR